MGNPALLQGSDHRARQAACAWLVDAHRPPVPTLRPRPGDVHYGARGAHRAPLGEGGSAAPAARRPAARRAGALRPDRSYRREPVWPLALSRDLAEPLVTVRAALAP